MRLTLLLLLVSASWLPAMDLAGIASETALRHDLDPELVAAVVRVESAWDPGAVSPKGALGLMQLMPATARDLGVADPLDPADNLEGGCRYLRQMLDRFVDLRLALAAYNAGPEAVIRAGGVPGYAETRRYVERVIGVMRGDGMRSPRMNLARGAAPSSPIVSLAPSGAGIVLMLGGHR